MHLITKYTSFYLKKNNFKWNKNSGFLYFSLLILRKGINLHLKI